MHHTHVHKELLWINNADNFKTQLLFLIIHFTVYQLLMLHMAQMILFITSAIINSPHFPTYRNRGTYFWKGCSRGWQCLSEPIILWSCVNTNSWPRNVCTQCLHSTDVWCVLGFSVVFSLTRHQLWGTKHQSSVETSYSKWSSDHINILARLNYCLCSQLKAIMIMSSRLQFFIYV